jgi:hypothetical protein
MKSETILMGSSPRLVLEAQLLQYARIVLLTSLQAPRKPPHARTVLLASTPLKRPLRRARRVRPTPALPAAGAVRWPAVPVIPALWVALTAHALYHQQNRAVPLDMQRTTDDPAPRVQRIVSKARQVLESWSQEVSSARTIWLGEILTDALALIGELGFPIVVHITKEPEGRVQTAAPHVSGIVELTKTRCTNTRARRVHKDQ